MSIITTKIDLQKISAQHIRNKENFYFILDCACDDHAFEKMFSEEGVLEYVSLFKNTDLFSVFESGPMLLRVDIHSPFFEWIWSESPRLHAGIILFSPLTIEDLFKQLKEYVFVKDHNNAKKVFRFYDPRNIQWALNVMPEEDRVIFINQISALYVSRYTPDKRPYFETVIEVDNGANIK